MNVEFNFKQGDCVFFTDTYNNDYVDIIGDYNEVNDSVEEIVSVMYNDRNGGDEEGSIYYRTTLFLKTVQNIRLATKEEVTFLKNALEDDGNMFDKNKMEVVNCETDKKNIFHLTRNIILKSYYTDIIDVEADNLENALNIAKEKFSTQKEIWDSMNKNEITLDEIDIERAEITNEDGSDCREVNFY